jgi:alkanesulfonate monooxygenase SsuD/methylene tetrahydromethanopterin reductase-like flavin-dependent oxidoreductase (luciferase family)
VERLEFGLFSHLEVGSGSSPLSALYEEHLAFLEAAEQAGFWGYHLAEHHNTPLNAAPSPGLFLAAASQRTKRLRLGVMVYLLPFYHPLRLIDEIAMLDHLSHGRLEVGVGRGVSPFEHGLFGNPFLEPDHRAMYEEALEVLMKGLVAGDTLSHDGRYYHVAGAPIVLRALQQPHPPLWVGFSNEEGARSAAESGICGATLASTELATRFLEVYRAEWRRSNSTPALEPRLGLTRLVFVADSDAEAERIARPAYAAHAENLEWLPSHYRWRDMKVGHPFDEYASNGGIVFGSPARVLDELTAQLQQVRPNYLILNMKFGSLSAAQSLRSLELFATRIQPELAKMAPAVSASG